MTSNLWRHEVIAFKRRLLERELARHQGNLTHTAKTLGLTRNRVQRLVKELGADRAGNSAHGAD